MDLRHLHDLRSKSAPVLTEESKPLSDAAAFRRASSAFPHPSNSTSNDMKGKNMSTWLIDTPLFSMLQTAKAKPLLEWCEANDASLFISAAPLLMCVRNAVG